MKSGLNKMPLKQNTLDLCTEGSFFVELIIQTIKEDAIESAYEDVRSLFKEQREAVKRGEDPSKIRKEYGKKWNNEIRESPITHEEPTLTESTKGEQGVPRLSQIDNLHTKESKQHMQNRVLEILKRGRKKTIEELAEETGLTPRTIYRYIKEWEPLHFLTLNKGVVELLAKKVPFYFPETEPGYHHVYVRFANQKRGDPPPNLKKYCKKIMATHPYFIGHPNRKITPWPMNAEHPEELFIECGDDQLMASQMQILMDHLTDDLGELEFYGYDLALDVNGRRRRLSVFFQEDDHDKMETQIKVYPCAKDIQRIEAANMNLPIRTPEDALIVAQIMDFRIDLAGQLIHSKNTNKALSKALHDALVRIGELEVQIDVLADTALLRRFKVPSGVET